MWITNVAYAKATGKLRKLYDRIKGPDNVVDQIMMAHSLRPHTMEGHMTLYKYVLHHSANTVPKWFLETLGVHVSLLNNCSYCVDHHFAGLCRLLGDDGKASDIRAILEGGGREDILSAAQQAALDYATQLTLEPQAPDEELVIRMREAGYDDGEILEINQVVAYFNYANRTVLGLGVTTEGDILGLSPNESDDPDNWAHT